VRKRCSVSIAGAPCPAEKIFYTHEGYLNDQAPGFSFSDTSTWPGSVANPLIAEPKTQSQGVYAQDSWKLMSNLTINAGVRFDHSRAISQDLKATDVAGRETGAIIRALRERFPDIHAPKKEDICYATSNRQWAVKEMFEHIDLLLVIGSRNSSNSNRLVEVARAAGVESYLIDDESEIDERWLEGVETVGLTSGASAPERLVTRVCHWFRDHGVTDIEQHQLVDEGVEFRLPVELRRELELAETQG